MLKPQCVSTSLCLRLYSPRERIRKAVSLSETRGDADRYKEMKREKTHRDSTGYVWSAEIFFPFQDSKILQNPTKAERKVKQLKQTTKQKNTTDPN